VPLKGNLDRLHPEFEIADWRGRSYFADFAWESPWNIVFLIEIKGYNKHVRDLDRSGFNNDLNRELFLQGIGYRVVSITFDNVNDEPNLCITLLRLFFSHFQSADCPIQPSQLGEREIIQFAFRLARPFRPIEVSRHIQTNYRTTLRLLQQLVKKGWIDPVPTGDGKRIVWYKVAEGAIRYLS
jgi:hypothetical protein